MSMKKTTKINHWPILRYFQSLEKRGRHGESAKKRWSMRVGTIVNPDSHTIVLLVLIIVLLLLNLMLRFPDFGEIIGDYNKF